jgi:hypothetical protein
MSEPNEIVGQNFVIRRRPDGIVHLAWAPQTRMTLDDAQGAIAAMVQLTGGRPSPLLVNTQNAATRDRDARMEFVRRADLVTAVALIVATPLSRIMGNFFLSVNSPSAPTRLFDDEESAIAWLSGGAS